MIQNTAELCTLLLMLNGMQLILWENRPSLMSKYGRRHVGSSYAWHFMDILFQSDGKEVVCDYVPGQFNVLGLEVRYKWLRKPCWQILKWVVFLCEKEKPSIVCSGLFFVSSVCLSTIFLLFVWPSGIMSFRVWNFLFVSDTFIIHHQATAKWHGCYYSVQNTPKARSRWEKCCR